MRRYIRQRLTGAAFFGGVACCLLTLNAHASPLLRIGSDDWCPFVCAHNGMLDGGFLIDVTTQAMALEGYRVEPVLIPLNRAMRETATGGLEGVYAPPNDPRLRLSVPLAYSRACFYTRTNERWTYRGMDSLHSMTVGIIDNYGYDNGEMDAYINSHLHAPALSVSYGVTAGISNVQKLLGGRYSVILEHESVMGQLTRTLDIARQVRQAGCLAQPLPLTIGFASQDIRSADWARALARGLQQMQANGQLAALRRHYDISQETKPDH